MALTKPHQASPLAIDQVAIILATIAQQANEADRLMYYQLGHFDGTSEVERHASLVLNSLRSTLTTLGMLSDLAIAKLTGCEEIRGGIEGWLMPPSYPLEERSAPQSQGSAS